MKNGKSIVSKIKIASIIEKFIFWSSDGVNMLQ